MKSHVLLFVLSLSACASLQSSGGEVDGAQGNGGESRKSSVKPEPAQPQRPAPAEAQVPDTSGQGDALPRKSEHNIEED
ncbi:MAG TPA: hypothetical protein VGD24_09675 [Gallionella sp.]